MNANMGVQESSNMMNSEEAIDEQPDNQNSHNESQKRGGQALETVRSASKDNEDKLHQTLHCPLLQVSLIENAIKLHCKILL